MATLVRNTAAGPVVFSDKTTDTAIEWQGAEDPSEGHLQQVPDHLLENVNFLRAVNKGILVIEAIDNKEAAEKFSRQGKLWAERAVATDKATVDAIEHTTNNDMIMEPCVGPATKGQGTCKASVPVREKTKHDTPTLCPTHESLRGQYVLSESETLVDGKALKVWSRMGMGSTEHQVQR